MASSFDMFAFGRGFQEELPYSAIGLTSVRNHKALMFCGQLDRFLLKIIGCGMFAFLTVTVCGRYMGVRGQFLINVHSNVLAPIHQLECSAMYGVGCLDWTPLPDHSYNLKFAWIRQYEPAPLQML